MNVWQLLDEIGYPDIVFPDCVENEIYRPDENNQEEEKQCED